LSSFKTGFVTAGGNPTNASLNEHKESKDGADNQADSDEDGNHLGKESGWGGGGFLKIHKFISEDRIADLAVNKTGEKFGI